MEGQTSDERSREGHAELQRCRSGKDADRVRIERRSRDEGKARVSGVGGKGKRDRSIVNGGKRRAVDVERDRERVLLSARMR